MLFRRTTFLFCALLFFDSISQSRSNLEFLKKQRVFLFYFILFKLFKYRKGYLATFINPYSGNTLCSFNKFDTGALDLEENFTIYKKTICANSFKSGYENVLLEREFYKITLSLKVPDLKENYNFGSFGVNAFFINKNGEINKFTSLVF